MSKKRQTFTSEIKESSDSDTEAKKETLLALMDEEERRFYDNIDES